MFHFCFYFGNLYYCIYEWNVGTLVGTYYIKVYIGYIRFYFHWKYTIYLYGEFNKVTNINTIDTFKVFFIFFFFCWIYIQGDHLISNITLDGFKIAIYAGGDRSYVVGYVPLH